MNAAQQIMTMRKEVAAYHALVSGEFAAEIARMEALETRLAESQKIASTLDAAKAILLAAETQAEKLREEAAKNLEASRTTLAAAKASEAAAAKALDESRSQVQDAQAQLAVTHREVRSAVVLLDKAKSEHGGLLGKIAEREAELTAREAALAERQKKFEARLEHLRTPV